jgi:hypothetical protein
MSFLMFDGDELQVSLFDSKGTIVGRWPASNRGGGASDFKTLKSEAFVSFIPDGEYEFEPHSQHAPQRHADKTKDTVDGVYGTLGILRLKDIVLGGHRHVGLGVHAGRQGKYDSMVVSRKPLQQIHHASAYYRTNGCIRTTEQAMRAIAGVITRDPLKKLVVRNNGKHPIEKAAGYDAQRV